MRKNGIRCGLAFCALALLASCCVRSSQPTAVTADLRSTDQKAIDLYKARIRDLLGAEWSSLVTKSLNLGPSKADLLITIAPSGAVISAAPLERSDRKLTVLCQRAIQQSKFPPFSSAMRKALKDQPLEVRYRFVVKFDWHIPPQLLLPSPIPQSPPEWQNGYLSLEEI